MEQQALTALDRCDRCGAQARARTEHANGILLWCSHHFYEHADVLSDSLVYLDVEDPETSSGEPART